MKTPEQFSQEPGKLPTPPLCPGSSSTPRGTLSMHYRGGSCLLGHIIGSRFRVLRGQSRTCSPKTAPVWSISHFGFRFCFGFLVSDFGFPTLPLCSFVVSPGFCRTVVAPDCSRLHQIAANCASRPGARPYAAILAIAPCSTLHVPRHYPRRTLSVTSGHSNRLSLPAQRQ